MSGILINTRNEWEKWLLQRKAKWLLLVLALLPAASALLIRSIGSNSGILLVTGEDLPLAMLRLLTAFLLPLLLFMTAADSFTVEMADRTIKNVLLRPIARSGIFASKVLALGAVTVVILAIVGISSALSGMFLLPSVRGTGWWAGAGAYAAAVIPMLTVGLFAVLVAQWWRSGTMMIVTCILVYGAVKLLPLVVPEAAYWSPFAYTGWHELWIGGGVQGTERFQVFALLAGYCMISYTGALMLFARKQY